MGISSTFGASVVFTLFAYAACYYVSGCREPAEPGPCKASFERWYFDSNTTTCRRFIYGGCRGNDNNFESKLECRRKCSPSYRPLSVCKKKPDPGPCKASFERWYFDQQRGYCQKFIYGGCKGNGNRFASCKKCMEACGKRGSSSVCKKLSHTQNESDVKPALPK
uniref:BPTI/Kunitz inhibitor domain-containing protein n=1 Tax=Amblyomma triste TaxID=251400 RepID=A0A023G2V3_AMBTT